MIVIEGISFIGLAFLREFSRRGIKSPLVIDLLIYAGRLKN